MGNKKRPMFEFSKVVVCVSTIVSAAVLIFVLALMWITQSTDGIAYIIPSVFAFLTFTYRQYYIKACQENQIKLKRKYGDDYLSPNEVIGKNDD